MPRFKLSNGRPKLQPMSIRRKPLPIFQLQVKLDLEANGLGSKLFTQELFQNKCFPDFSAFTLDEDEAHGFNLKFHNVHDAEKHLLDLEDQAQELVDFCQRTREYLKLAEEKRKQEKKK